MASWDDYTVADVMTIDPITVGVDESIEQAEHLLRLYRITGLPVVGADGEILGVISQSDLLWRGDLPISVLLRRKPSGLRVGELMSSPALTVALATPLCEAARTMRDQHVHRVVAVSDDGRPIGVLSAMDFVALAADGG